MSEGIREGGCKSEPTDEGVAGRREFGAVCCTPFPLVLPHHSTQSRTRLLSLPQIRYNTHTHTHTHTQHERSVVAAAGGDSRRAGCSPASSAAPSRTSCARGLVARGSGAGAGAKRKAVSPAAAAAVAAAVRRGGGGSGVYSSGGGRNRGRSGGSGALSPGAGGFSDVGSSGSGGGSGSGSGSGSSGSGSGGGSAGRFGSGRIPPVPTTPVTTHRPFL